MTFHGFALNIDCDLAEFARIQPCGLDAQVMGSLTSLGAAFPAPAALRCGVAAAIAHAFQRDLIPTAADPPAPTTSGALDRAERLR